MTVRAKTWTKADLFDSHDFSCLRLLPPVETKFFGVLRKLDRIPSNSKKKVHPHCLLLGTRIQKGEEGLALKSVWLRDEIGVELLCSVLRAWCLVYTSAFLGQQPKYLLHFWTGSWAINTISHPIHSYMGHPAHFHGLNLPLFGVCWMQISWFLVPRDCWHKILIVLSSLPVTSSHYLL